MGISKATTFEEYQRIDRPNAFVTYYGKTKDKSIDGTATAKWQIIRETIQGLQTVREYSADGEYTGVWDNRNAAFPPTPFINTYSILFDGVNDYVNVPHSSTIDFDRLNAFSLACWVKTTATGTFTMMEKASGATGYSLNVTSSRLTFEHGQAAGNRIRIRTTSNITWNNGNWHLITSTYSGSGTAAGAALYVDGVLQTTEVQNDTSTLSSLNGGPLRIASNASGGSTFTGFMDEVAVFDIQMSLTNIGVMYNSGIPTDLDIHPNAASMRGWWRMGEGDTFPTILDNFGSNNGTMTNQVSGNIVTVIPP